VWKSGKVGLVVKLAMESVMTAAKTALKSLVTATAATLAFSAYAAGADAVQTTGTLVVVPASGEVQHANDQVVATLAIEEQDKDKAVAASRVNTKMRQGWKY
jgi:uncharacterized protein YggE